MNRRRFIVAASAGGAALVLPQLHASAVPGPDVSIRLTAASGTAPLRRGAPTCVIRYTERVLGGRPDTVRSIDSHLGPTLDLRRGERVKREVLLELLEKGRLDAAVGSGIERFVDKQRQARADAQARQQQRAAALAKNVRRISAQRDHVIGNPDPTVSLIEYSDFQCPFCKRFHATPKAIVDAHEGKVNWVYRHFPLALHNPGAQKQAERSECADALGGNDAFWMYADRIYERTRSNGNGFPGAGLVPLTEEIGLDGDAFGECLESERYPARVQEDYNKGVAIGISGTPGTILVHNGSGESIPRLGVVPVETSRAPVDRIL